METVKKIGFFILVFLAFTARANATDRQAAGCSRAQILAAYNTAVAGDRIVIPEGNCTWASTDLEIDVTIPVSFIGAGINSTVITLSAPAGTCTSQDFIYYTTAVSGGAVDISNIGFLGRSCIGVFMMDGKYTSLRLHHLKFTNVAQGRGIIIGYQNASNPANPAIYGLVDHVTWIHNLCEPFGLHYGKGNAWKNPDNWGTSQFFFVEQNTAVWNVATACQGGADFWDGEHGAREVIRFNDITNGTVMGHDTGSTQHARGQRVKEIYANTFHCNARDDCGWAPIDLRGGSQIIYNNVVPLCVACVTTKPCTTNCGFEVGAQTQVWRIDGSPGRSDPWDFKCNEPQQPMASDFRSHFSQPPYGVCGLGETGAGSCVRHPAANQLPSGITLLGRLDGTGPGNYPCRDQTGWGQDSADHTTQTRLPVYIWNNTDPNRGNAQVTSIGINTGNGPYIQTNREVFIYTAGFNGTAGVGRGLLSARPSTCSNTTYPGPGYFATDTNTLYRCTAQDVWTSYYRPFTYPHPLQTGRDSPAAPTNLRVVVR